MEFNPGNIVIQLCLQGMKLEENNEPGKAGTIFLQAWNAASNDFEKFIASWYVARHQPNSTEKLKWYESALQFALKVNNDAVKAALPSLYSNIAGCYEELGDNDHAKRQRELSLASACQPSDKGPFYHGTKADLKTGDLLTAGRVSNYHPELVMNHIYFTALTNGAGLAASLARGEGLERVYIVEPTGGFEDDPNVTNKKFPGNTTRSYRTKHPLKIIGEVTDWQRQTPEQLQQWREKLAGNKGEIIN
ncbi:NAD(+)--rifampin ADP-ribosyltransferase [Pararcticibacter amylolyticus]|uniref:NAD(+)--rifampin ADP-ribosyltransferase n=1 Tax=Pararcticibacter amylolyticus TaxID=2173175 RepID=A0A2U2PH09_9SPHI|nr:NAD(+)--rifampin ADP-ribosyltransferase [Pararcticibacter amylolyticus]PWG80554.1 NAD(+)--rifampin ADP-ribosyltransferase [Pararcticibacter amylolyticus]